jgi:TatD DNase family protein
MIDSHCHLDFDYLPKTTDDVICEARQAGILALITIATEIKNLEKIARISETYPEVFHTVGVHPHEAKDLDFLGVELMRQAALHPKCCAVGEIGLDYFYHYSTEAEQKKALVIQLALARELKLPVVIHSREAESDLLPLLEEHAKLSTSPVPGVLHCFTGTRAFGEACLKAGYFISFSGILTFKKAEELQENAKFFSLDRLLIETDAPFLAPIPFRGKKCEPYMVKFTAVKLAELRGISLDEVLRKTTENAIKVFGLPT